MIDRSAAASPASHSTRSPPSLRCATPSSAGARTGDRATQLAEKYGVSREQAVDMQQGMTDTAAGEGLELRFDLARAGNTFDAHRLVHLGAAHGREDELEERFLRAYLTEGEPIGDPGALERLAVEAGLPEDEAGVVLATELYAQEVRDDERTAAGLGINAVPFFVVDRRFAASGAQPPEALRGMLDRAFEARSPLSVVAEGDACGPDGC